jgi:DnaJ-class molecular chaperone
MNKTFDLEKHGMIVCPECNGRGKLISSPKGIKICHKCGGFGLVKKEENPLLVDGIEKYFQND